MFGAKKKTHEVFGVSNEILPDSYVDRGSLDQHIQTLLGRRTHIALRGESKCGKSWMRQKNIPDAVTVQCRINKTVADLYVDILSQLDVQLTLEYDSSSSLKGTVSAKGEFGLKLLGKIGVDVGAEKQRETSEKRQRVGHDINDLRFIADLIKAADRRVVIEDFHYMSVRERSAFAFDLKALWDYGVFVTIIGVWTQSNMLLHLNSDLTGRIEEVSIYWSNDDLDRIIDRGSGALSIAFASPIKQRAIADCFGNAGILQKLILDTLDEVGIGERQDRLIPIDDLPALESAAMAYAEQLNPLYQQFATRVSRGIQKRANSTGIYAHAMAVILETSDELLMKGLSLDEIFERAHARQSRIQKGNLRKVLEKFEDLQVDPEGRGLVLSYNEATSEITVVDRQLLLYRRYATVKWPWEQMIAEANASGDGFDAEEEATPDS